MSNPLAEYLSALEARDTKEHAHKEYIDAYTKLADRTAAALPQQASSQTEQPPPSPTISTRSLRPGTPKGKGAPASSDASPSSLAQMRAELASTQKIRGELESKLDAQSTELSAYKTADAEQKKRIAHLEKIKEALERRMRDRAEELKGKGKFVTDVQDELVALNLQLNVAEQEKEKLRKENEDLTRRWVERMEDEAVKKNQEFEEESEKVVRRQ